MSSRTTKLSVLGSDRFAALAAAACLIVAATLFGCEKSAKEKDCEAFSALIEQFEQTLANSKARRASESSGGEVSIEAELEALEQDASHYERFARDLRALALVDQRTAQLVTRYTERVESLSKKMGTFVANVENDPDRAGSPEEWLLELEKMSEHGKTVIHECYSPFM